MRRTIHDVLQSGALRRHPHPTRDLVIRLAQRTKTSGQSHDRLLRRLLDQVKFEVVVAGNMTKFGQNKAMRKVLMGTLCRPQSPEKGAKKESGSLKSISAYDGRIWRGREHVEAASRDRIWGIGFTAANALKADKEKWGQNLLGKALMEVRKRLVEEQIAKGMWEDGGEEEEDDEDNPREEQSEEKNERDEEVLSERDEPARIEGKEKEEGKGKKIDL